MADTTQQGERKRAEPMARKFKCEHPGCGKKFGLMEYLEMHQVNFKHKGAKEQSADSTQNDSYMEKQSEEERSGGAPQWWPEEQVFIDPYATVTDTKIVEQPPIKEEKHFKRRVEILSPEEMANSNSDLGDESQDNICKDCGKAFSSKYNLDRHIQLHKGVRYPCTICGKVYSQKYAWGQHMKQSHKEWKESQSPYVRSGERTWKAQARCPYCSEYFPSQGEIEDHMKSTHCIAPENKCE